MESSEEIDSQTTFDSQNEQQQKEDDFISYNDDITYEESEENQQILKQFLIAFQMRNWVKKDQPIEVYIDLFFKKRARMIQNFKNGIWNKKQAIQSLADSYKKVIALPAYQNLKQKLEAVPQKTYQMFQEKKNLLNFQRILVKDLTYDWMHKGLYVEVRIMMEPLKGKGPVFHFISEDTSTTNDVDNQVVVNVFGLDQVYGIKYFQEGQRLAILNPYLRLATDCTTFIVVEDKLNIVFLKNDIIEENPLITVKESSMDELLKPIQETMNATQLKNQGNVHFQAEHYQLSINLYSRAIEEIQPGENDLHAICYGNRCEAYLQLGQYQKAYDDSVKSLELVPNAPKQLFRQARAMTYLDKEEEALKLMKEKCGPETPELLLAIEQCKDRIAMRQGVYNYSRLLEQQKDIQNRLNVQLIEYTGPIEVKIDEKSGRGLYVTRDVKKGELLLVEKAMFINKKREIQRLEMEQCLTNLINAEQIPVLRNAQVELFNSEHKRLIVNAVYNTRNQNEPVDLANFEESARKISENEESKFKVEELQNVIKYNASQCWNLDEVFKFLKSGKSRQQYKPVEFGKVTAVWAKFSMMNHSCEMNTNRFSIGDVIFVNAIKDLKKGDQLFTTYVPIDVPYIEKANILKWYKFACECSGCVTASTLEPDQQGLLRLIWKEVMNKNITSAEQRNLKIQFYLDIYPKAEATFGNLFTDKYIPELHLLLQEMMILYSFQKKPKEFADIWNKYKHTVYVIQDLINVRALVERNFGTDNDLFKDVDKTYNETFEIFYGSDPKIKKLLE